MLRECGKESSGVRREFLDIAKGFGILFVVIGHTGSPWKEFLYQFHVPLFFIISGMVFYAGDTWAVFLKKKIRGLYLPYIISNLCALAVIGAAESWTVLQIVKKGIKILFLADKIYILGATWFLASLFFISVLFYVKINYLDSKHYYVKCISDAGLLLCGIVVMYLEKNPWKICTTLEGAMFFLIGMRIKSRDFYRKSMIAWNVISIIFICFCLHVNTVDMASNTYTSPVLFLISSFAGSCCVLGISYKLEEIKTGTVGCMRTACDLLAGIGRNTRPVLIWHFIWFKLVILLQIAVYQLKWDTFWSFPVCEGYRYWWMLYALVGIAGPLGSAWLCRRMFAKYHCYIQQ